MGKKVGLALGGGGAKGLAHIPVLEVLDEYGIRPKAIAGSSIGAIIGAIYASGIKATEIRDFIDAHFLLKKKLQFLRQDSRNFMKIVKLLDIDIQGTGLIRGENFSHFLYGILETEFLEDLEIPLAVIATDFHDSSQLVIREGPIIPALKASMSVPGVFSPSIYLNRVLIDGSCVNPVPWDVLSGCNLRIAVSVLGRTAMRPDGTPPRVARIVLEAFDIPQRSIVAQKYQHDPPDILLDPPITGVGLFDFAKANEIYRMSEGIVGQLKRFLDRAL